MASSYASYASWLSVDDTEPPKSVEPPKSAEPPKSVDQVGWVELATQATQTDEDPLDYRWDGSTWLGPGDWETDPVDITPGKSEVGSQQPQDEAEPPKPPTKRQCRSKASLLGLEGSQLSFSLSQSQPVGGKYPEDNSSEWHKCWWRESLKAGAYLTQPVDGSQSQQIDWATVSVVVIDGSQSQPVVDGS